MKTVYKLLPKEQLDLCAKYNTSSKLNTFLYNNPAVEELLKEKYDGFNRSEYIHIGFEVESLLIDYIHTNYHGKKCIVDGTEGIIQHPRTRRFDNNTKEIGNTISFRYDEELKEEVIALWVNTDNKYTSHFYKCTLIKII